ncbi:MAG: twin-arginine translocase TatA/TatE family subunit [Campylobacter sp.]|nr:twin-arginine translocase TatA/TatE family subunit [Campylobacter sp.]
MGAMSISHWLIVLVIIVLLFGAKKLPELAKGVGKSIKVFKKEMEDDEKKVEAKDDEKVVDATVVKDEKVDKA